jgi:hypothetical protein
MYRVTAIDEASLEQLDQWDQFEPVEQWQHEAAHQGGCFLDICRFEIEPAFSDLLGVHHTLEYELEEYDEGFTFGPL